MPLPRAGQEACPSSLGERLRMGTEAGPNLSVLAVQGREVTDAGNPGFLDCEEGQMHSDLTARDWLPVLLTPGWSPSWARTPPRAATGARAATAVMEVSPCLEKGPSGQSGQVLRERLPH